MPISFRTSRNIGLGILLVIIFIIGTSSYLTMNDTVRKLKTVIVVEEAKLYRYSEVTDLAVAARESFFDYINKKSESISSIVLLLDDALKRLDIIANLPSPRQEREILREISSAIKRFKTAVFGYYKEVEEKYEGGTSAQELEHIALEQGNEIINLAHSASEDVRQRVEDNHNQVLKAIALSQKFLTLVIVLGILSTFFIVFLMSYALGYPMRQLLTGTKEIARGNLNHKIDIVSRDEFGQLGEAFNKMSYDLKKSRTELLSSRELLMRVTEGIEEGIMLLDTEFRILWANKKISELGHLDTENMVGNFCYKVTHRRDTPCKAPHDICPMVEVLKTEKPASVIHTHFDEKGNKFYAEVTVYPVRDKEGRIKQFIHIARDITELKRYAENLEKANLELKETRAKLIQSAKMAAIGQLAGGVAHEINNPLTGVLNNVQLIKLEVQEKEKCGISEVKDTLDAIEESALRCKRIIRSLLDFSRASKLVYWPVAVNEIIEKMLLLTETEIKLENVRIIRELSENLPLVMADSNQLQQAFLNLINNAVWALKEKKGGDLRIKSEAANDDKSVSIIFSDTGCGIPPENLPHIFEPFFTTKKTQEGTGLGLSICYGIIKEHMGAIEVSSQGVGKGATFKITLPSIGALPK